MENLKGVFENIRIDFLACKSPYEIEGISHIFLDEDLKTPIKSLKDLLLRSRELHKYTIGEGSDLQPPVQYRTVFVERVLQKLQSLFPGNDACHSASVCKLWEDSLSQISGSAVEPFYRWYTLPNSSGSIKIFENDSPFTPEATTGLVIWPAANEFIKWIPTQDLNGYKWIIELGSGCGLVAIAMTRLFPHLQLCIATDCHPSVVRKCQLNVVTNNGVGSQNSDIFLIEEIDWERDGHKFKDLVKNAVSKLGPGILIGTDIVFDPRLVAPLTALIRIHLSCHLNGVAYIATAVRRDDILENLANDIKQSTEDLEIEEAHTWGRRQGIIQKITRKHLS